MNFPPNLPPMYIVALFPPPMYILPLPPFHKCALFPPLLETMRLKCVSLQHHNTTKTCWYRLELEFHVTYGTTANHKTFVQNPGPSQKALKDPGQGRLKNTLHWFHTPLLPGWNFCTRKKLSSKFWLNIYQGKVFLFVQKVSMRPI